jgi:hypothetical protein
MRYAIVNSDNIAVNVIELEDAEVWTPPEDHSLVAGDGNIGDSWDGTQFHAPAQPPRPLAEIQAAAVATVSRLRDERLAAGYADAVTGKTYQCDPAARGNWTAMFLATQLPGDGNITIITADNSTITLPPADLQALFAIRMMPWVQAVIHAGRAAKDAVLAATDDAGVNAVLASLAWPV